MPKRRTPVPPYQDPVFDPLQNDKTEYRDDVYRNFVLNKNPHKDPRTRWAVDAFGNRDSPNYPGYSLTRIFGKGKYPDAYLKEMAYNELPMQFLSNSPEMEALNSIIHARNPNTGVVFRESQNPIGDRNRIAGNPSRVVEYNSRSSRGAGARKRLYKANDGNDGKRATRTKKHTYTSTAEQKTETKQGGFVNGKPVSIKKFASKNKYF